MTRLEQLHHEGLTFDITDEGPVDGDPVVLLHGFPERATSWRKVAPILHEAGLRTYAMDQRGYSPGARPGRRRDYRVQHLVGDVDALVRAIGRPVHLVGHDWGANVAWAVTGQRPETVRTLTAVSVPHPAAFTAALTSSDQALRSWYILLFQLPAVVEASARVGGGKVFERLLRQAGMDEGELARVRTEVVEDGALPHAVGWYRALPLSDRSLLGRSIEVPTTMVWSDRDTALARRGVDLTARYVRGDYELVVLEGVTHWIPTQAPEALAAAILARIGSVGP